MAGALSLERFPYEFGVLKVINLVFTLHQKAYIAASGSSDSSRAPHLDFVQPVFCLVLGNSVSIFGNES